MMTRKKRITLLISIVTVFIFIIATVFIVLYLTTDLFKSNETLFLKYIGKNVQNVATIQKILENTEYDNLLETSKYTGKTEAKVNYTNNLGTTSEDNSNAINKLKLQIEGQTDKTNQYNYKDIKLLNEEEKEFELEYLQNENIYGIRFSDLFNQYLLVENDNLKELLKNMGYTDENLENVPDSIGFTQDMLDNFKFSEEELNTLSDKYLNLIKQKLSKDQFQKQSKQTITINEQKIIANSYTLNLTKEQLNDLYVLVLENLKEDEIFLGKTDNIQKMLEQTGIFASDTSNIREEIVNSIEKTINEIKNNNIGSEETKIIVYESDRNTVRTTIQGVDYEFNIDYLPIENEKFIEINFKENSKETKKITIDNKDSAMNIYLENNENNIPIKFEFSKNIEIEGKKCQKKVNTKYETDSDRVELSIIQNIDIVDNFDDKIEINDKNGIKLNELKSEKLKNILNKVNKGVQNELNNIKQEVKLEDIQDVLEVLGFIPDIQKLERTGVSETEKNRFNSKFEILEGEELDNEKILEVIKVVEENLKNIEVVSNKKLKMEISQTEKNEKLGKAVENFIEKDKNRKYNLSVEYDDDTGLVKYIIMTIVKEN